MENFDQTRLKMVPAHKVPTEWFLPKGSYRKVPAKKVPTKKVPGNIGPWTKGSWGKSSCHKGSQD
jgi:hypothetical protein